MLEHVNHPFICNLRYSFQDIEYMYARPLVPHSMPAGPRTADHETGPANKYTGTW